MTKSCTEIGLTLATIWTNSTFRHDLLEVRDTEEFQRILVERSDQLIAKFGKQNFREDEKIKIMNAFGGVIENLRRRAGFYFSDFTDGVKGKNTINKVIATTFFLYFLCLLPCVAFGVLNANNTGNKIGMC